MELRYCENCVMDGSAEELVLDSDGVCNFCHIAQKALKEIEAERLNFVKWIAQIKKDGKGKKYDVLIGLSGGADSSTLLHHAVELGLRPLCYSIDNGYNDPKADSNIMQMVEGLKVPFYRYTIDLPKFKDLQSAFIKAGLKNLEIPTDHILMASSLEMASRYGIKWILSGGNVNGESIMPPSWGYNARDLTHIKDVYKKSLKGLPTCGLLKWNYYKWIKGIKTFYLLDYLDYNVKQSKELLSKEYGWQPHYEKHCESIFTWWFQNFYLYEKWGIDKRKAHLSSLINSGQMTRSEAKAIIGERPVFPELGLEQQVMKYPKREHSDFAQDKWFDRISKVIRTCRYITTSIQRFVKR